MFEKNQGMRHRERYLKSIVYYYCSPYMLSEDEELALSYGLENHIPTETSRIAINTEFERFTRDYFMIYLIFQKKIYHI